MRTSISVATSACGMPQIMFNGQWEQAASQLAALGYAGLDLFIPDPINADIDHIADMLQSMGLGVSMLAAQGDIMGDGYFLNDPDPTRLETLLERSKRHLDMAAKLSTLPNIGFIRGNFPKNPQEKEQSLQHMAQGLHRYCELAKSFGVGVLLEPICRYEINSCNTVAESLHLMELAGNPENLTLLLDVFHMNIEEASLTNAIANAKGRIGHVHFVDNTRAIPGHGCLPLKTIYAALVEAQYDGFLGVEAVPGPKPLEEAAAALTVIHSFMQA